MFEHGKILDLNPSIFTGDFRSRIECASLALADEAVNIWNFANGSCLTANLSRFVRNTDPVDSIQAYLPVEMTVAGKYLFISSFEEPNPKAKANCAVPVTPGPLNFTGYIEGTPLTASSPLNVVCSTCGGYPPPTVEVYIVGTDTVLGQTSAQDSTTLCTSLSLDYASIDYRFVDGNSLRCQVVSDNIFEIITLTIGECRAFEISLRFLKKNPLTWIAFTYDFLHMYSYFSPSATRPAPYSWLR